MKKKFYRAAALLLSVLTICGCEDMSEAASTASGYGTLPFVSTASPDELPAIAMTSYTAPEVRTDAPADEDSSGGAVSSAKKTARLKDADTGAFHERLEQICEENGVYGMGVAVFANGKVIHTDSVGYADMENEIPVTENTKFRAASASKLISTILVMKLCDEGMLDFDGDLTEQTGLEYYCEQTGEVKLWHVLTHTAGLTDTYEYDVLSPSQRFSTNYLLKSAHIGTKAGEFYNYSNFGAGTMGAIVECITGMFFHRYADKVLFKPLNMDAAYLVDLLKDRDSCAKIYDHDGEVFDVPHWVRTSAYYESFGLGNSYLTAQCELLITARDLALLGTALAGDGTVNGVRIISEDSLNKMHDVYIETDYYGMGLNVRQYRGNLVDDRTICGHPGNALGAITGLFYDRTDGTGVALLTNRSNYYEDAECGLYRTDSAVVKAAYEAFFR